MKTMSSNEYSSFTALIPKLVGVVLILSFLLNFVTLLFPFQPLDRAWQISLTNQMVEPGVIPMVGLALIFVGHWIGNSTSDSPVKGKSWQDLRLWGLLFSIIFGLLFLALFPLHLNNISQASNQAVTQIDQEAANEENKLASRVTQAQIVLQQRQVQLRTQIDELLKNEQQYNQVLQSNKVPQELKDLLKESKANPKNIDQLVQQKLQQGLVAYRTKELYRIRSRQAEDETQARKEAWRSSLRIGSTCLLLAISYIAIGWIGLRSLGLFSSARRQSSAR